MSRCQNSTNPPGKQQFLVRWLQGGIARFRNAVGLPQNLISDQTVERICQALEDDPLLRTTEALGLANDASLREAANTAPDLDVALSTIEGQDAMRRWVVEHRPLLVLQALGEAVSRLTSHIIEARVPQSCRISRLLLVLAFAPFVPGGADLLSKLAAILGCHEPHRMIERFTRIAIKGEDTTIDEIDHIVLSNECWSGRVSQFMEQAQSLAPQCWGRLVVSRQLMDPPVWNALWDFLLNQKEEVGGN
jgi:hypothetical protein